MRQAIEPCTTVLLTGFGPFPGVPVNASSDLVRRIVRAARRRHPAARFAVAVLPTQWRHAQNRIEALHRRHRPALALHFGVASGTDGIRLETEARNFCRSSIDAAGALPPAPVLCAEGPMERHATIEISAIADALREGGWPVSISQDAGGYLCNAVLYHSLASAENRDRCQVGFVHIPSDLSNPALDATALIAAAITIIEVALGLDAPRATSEMATRGARLHGEQ
jgi:pyroglutamyl-peptidase